MRIGLSTTDFQPTPCDTLFKTVSTMGYECLQFSFASVKESEYIKEPHNEIPVSIKKDTVLRVKEAAIKYDLPITIINGTFNCACVDEGVRKEGIRRFFALADAAIELGVKYISLCTGTKSDIRLWAGSPLNNTEDAYKDCLNTIKPLLKIAEERDLYLALEVEPNNVISTSKQALRLINDCESNNLKVIFDGANLFYAGTAKKENVQTIINTAFDDLKDYIIVAHGKDVLESNEVKFCAAGKGIIDFDLMVKRLKGISYKGDMILHGIYDINDMPRALSYMKGVIEKA